MKSHLLAIVLATIATAASADPAEIARCRTIPEAAKRLACYDGITLPKAGAPATTAGAGAPPPAAASRAASSSEAFGLEQKTPAARLDALESTIPGKFEGWDSGTKFRLANGQVWQVADGSRGAYFAESPKVRIRRGLVGGFYLDIEGINRSPRVTRIQ